MKNESTSAKASRRSAGLQSAINIVLVVGILLAANYVGFVHYRHDDLSASQFYSLSPKTTELLHKLDAPVHITTILVSNDRAAYWDQTQKLLEQYVHLGGKNVTLDKVDPVYDAARAAALQQRLHFSGADDLIIFEYKDRTRFVKQADLLELNPMTGQVGGYKGEQEFTAAIQAMVEGKPSRIYFTAGHGEHNISDSSTAAGYGLVGATLKGENIEVADLNLAARGDVPPDADAVVIAGPSVPFNAAEAQALDKYVAANGKLLVLLDPYAPLGLEALLKKYSLSFDNDLVLYRLTNDTGGQTTLPLALILQGGFSGHPITAKFPQAGYYLQLPDARSITVAGDKTSPSPKAQWLLQTGPDSWGWINKNPLTNADLLTIKTRSYDKTTDLQGPLTIAALYDGGPAADAKVPSGQTGTRVILVGTSRFLENDAAESVGTNFFTNALDWLVKKNAVLEIAPKRATEYGVSLSPLSQRTVTWTVLFVIPGLALALGIFSWLSRRK